MGSTEHVVPRVSAEGSLEEDHGSLVSRQSEAPILGKCEVESGRVFRKKGKWWRRKRTEVCPEGHVAEKEEEEGEEEEEEEDEEEEKEKEVIGFKEFRRTKSLTDVDLHELKGCLDLGFGFSYDEIPELCNTLPALELCYSMSQRFLDEQQRQSSSSGSSSAASSDAGSVVGSPIANWKISSPGDRPEDVKARLKFWAQAVACTIRLCS